MDVVIEYEDKAQKQNLKLKYQDLVLACVYKMDHNKLVTDKDLLFIFERLTSKVVNIGLGLY